MVVVSAVLDRSILGSWEVWAIGSDEILSPGTYDLRTDLLVAERRS